MASPFDSLFKVEHGIPLPTAASRTNSFSIALAEKLESLNIGDSLLVQKPLHWGPKRFLPLYNAKKHLSQPMSFTQRIVSEDELRIWRTG